MCFLKNLLSKILIHFFIIKFLKFSLKSIDLLQKLIILKKNFLLKLNKAL